MYKRLNVCIHNCSSSVPHQGLSTPQNLDERLKEMRTSRKPLMLWVYE